jgi:hypothetical protein
MAVPTRTKVLPPATAASKSPLMPMDKVSSGTGQGVAGLERVKQGAGAAVHRQGGLKVGRGLGNGHEAAQHQARQGSHLLRQGQGLRRGHARLVGAAVDVHLQAHLQRRQVGGPLLGQALGNFQAVHRMHPVKVLGHGPGFVALQRAYAMPLQCSRLSSPWVLCLQPGAQGQYFFHAFLHVVFAKCALAGLHGLDDGIGAKGLGDGQQCHRCWRTARLCAGFVNALAQGVKLGCDAHPQTVPAAP